MQAGLAALPQAALAASLLYSLPPRIFPVRVSRMG
jgi:hypothetical protein